MRFVAAILVLIAGTATAADLHVDAVLGDDGNDGLSWAAPKRSIGAALAVAEVTPEADNVLVAEGHYTELLEIAGEVFLKGGYARGGVSRDWLVHRTVIDGQPPVFFGYNVLFPPGATGGFEGFVVTGEGLAFEACSGVVVTDNSFEDIIARNRVPAPVIRVGGRGAAVSDACVVFERNRIVRTDARRVNGERLGGYIVPVLELNSSGQECTFRDITVAGTLQDLPYKVAPDIFVHQGSASNVGRQITLQNVSVEYLYAGGTTVLENVDVASRLIIGCWIDFTAVNVTIAEMLRIQISPFRSYTQTIEDSILWPARWEAGTRGPCGTSPPPGIVNSIVPDARGEPGTFVADPLFVGGPASRHYLASVAAGQPADSPAIDRGSRDVAAAGLASRTTRTDGVPDTGVVDLGYHPPSSTTDPWLYQTDILRGVSPSALVAHGIGPLPWVDAPGTASDPSLRVLYYSVDPAQNTILVTLDRGLDAPRLTWR